MKRLVLFALVTAGVAFQLENTHAGGWTQPQGKGYFKLSEQIVRGESVFDTSGEPWNIESTLSRYTTSLYGEYGLIDRLTLVGYIPFYQRITHDIGDPAFNPDPQSGTADWDVGIRLGLITNRATVVALQVMAGLPFGDSEQPDFLFTGDGEFNQVFSLQLGHSLYPIPAYLKGEIGYNNRKSDFADELRYALEAGYTIGERVGISVWLRGTKALGLDENKWTRDDIQFVSIGPELNLYITPNAGISAGVTKYTSGRNLLDAPAWDIGIFLKL